MSRTLAKKVIKHEKAEIKERKSATKADKMLLKSAKKEEKSCANKVHSKRR